MPPLLQQPRIALYPGSFDLLTNGHVDLIRRAKDLFDKVIVAIGRNTSKQPFFSAEERLDILREATVGWDNVEVAVIRGLTIHFAEEAGAQFIVRGLRAVTDFEYELQLALTNQRLNPRVETIFLATDPENIFLSSSMIKTVWRYGGDISQFVPPAVLRALARKSRDELA